MTKLEKSVRHELKYYGTALRNGHYVTLGTTGRLKYNFQFLKDVYCDFEDGIVTGIRVYGYGDALAVCDYEGSSYDITEPVENYLSQETSWDQLISDICDYLIEQVEQEE